MKKDEIRLYEKRYNFETKQKLVKKSWRDTSETSFLIVLKIQVCMFWTDCEITRQRACFPCRAGPSSSRISIIWS